MMPSSPKAANPTGPTQGRRRDAEPSTAPISSAMTTMPTISAGLSPVLKMLDGRAGHVAAGLVDEGAADAADQRLAVATDAA